MKECIFMKRTKQLLAVLLICGMILQFIPMFHRASATPTLGTPDPGLNFYPNTSGVPDGFKTSEIVVGDTFNGVGVWLTEIHNNDVDRRASADNRAANGYEPVHVYDFGTALVDLMEFIEVVSTHDEDIRLNDLYEVYCGSTKLTITTVDGSSDVVLKRAQPTVLWNYRSDLGITMPTEEEFRTQMRVPDEAMVLKAVSGGNWAANDCSFAVKTKDGTAVSEFVIPSNSCCKFFLFFRSF